MPEDPLAFLDEPDASSQSESDPLSFLPEYSKSSLRKPARHAAQAAKGALNLNPIVAGYNLLTTSVREGAHRSRVRVSEQAKKDLERMDEKLAKGEPLTRKERIHYDRTKQLSERKSEKAAGIDTESLINRGVKAASGVDLEPEDTGEEITNIASSLISPRKALSAAQKIPKLFTKTGRQALSAERAAVKVKAGWDALTTATKGNPEKQGIVNFAQKNGLTPREATILLQSEKRVEHLGKASKITGQFKKDVAGLKEKLGAKYDQLKDIGKKGGYLGSKDTSVLTSDLQTIIDDIGNTLVKGPDTKGAMTALQDALFTLEHEGATVEQLINTRQNLSQQINWHNVDPKGQMLKQGSEAFAKAIEKANPAVGKQLRETDKYYKKYKNIRDVLDKKQGFIKIKGIPIGTSDLAFNTVGGITLALLHANPMTAAKIYGVKEGIQRLATAMLTNPKLQGVHKRLMKEIMRGDTERQRKLMVSLGKILKTDDPELYEELGFEAE